MKRWIVGVMFAAGVVVGCGTDLQSPRDTALLQLSLNRQKWSAQGIHNYSFNYDFTANVFSPPLHVEVRNDLVTQVTDRTTGATYANSTAPTVDTLFTRVETVIRNESADVTVTYDGQLGFPAKIEQPSSIPDGGSVTTVTSFQTVPPPP